MMQFFLARTQVIAMERLLSFNADFALAEAQ